jgi:hypothetical protein
MRDKYAETVRELLQAKVDQRAASNRGCAGGQGSPKEVINIMAALKENTQAKGRAKVRDAVQRRMGKLSEEEKPRPSASRPRPSPRRTAQTLEAPAEGEPRLGQRAKWREGFVSRLLKGLRLDRLLVVPETTSHSDCSRNDDCASK